MSTNFETVVSAEAQAKIDAVEAVRTVSLEDAKESNPGIVSISENEEFKTFLTNLGSADRFTGAIIGSSYRYSEVREAPSSTEERREYMIDFIDANDKTHGWFSRTFMNRVFIDKHGDEGGLNYHDHMKATKELILEFIVTSTKARTFQASDNVVTSQMCWDYKKLEAAMGADGARYCKTFRNLQSKKTTQDMKSEAYDVLATLNPVQYVKEAFISDGKMTADAIKRFVVCDLIIKPIEVTVLGQ